LFNDVRNFRPAKPNELANGGDWIYRALIEGAEISVFAPSATLKRQLARVARNLADACAEAEEFSTRAPREPSHAAAVREFIAKIERVSFAIVAIKARRFAAARRVRIKDAEFSTKLCAPAIVFASSNRQWRRLISVGEMRSAGREFHNCLAQANVHGRIYGERMQQGRVEFWVLRKACGEGLMIAVADVVEKIIGDVRGPCNAPIPSDDPDLMCLIRARGFFTQGDFTDPPRDPTPPRPPRRRLWSPRPNREEMFRLSAAFALRLRA
jgi:hypothetical protein